MRIASFAAARATLSAVLFALLVMAATPSFAQPAPGLELLTPTELRVAPGQSVQHAVRVRNIGDTAGTLRLIGHLSITNRFSDRPYTFGPSSNPRCGIMPAVAGELVDLTTDSLAPGEAIDCAWLVHRPLQSDFDTYLVWGAGAQPPARTPLTLLGTLTDTALATRTRAFHIDAQGIGHATIELSVQNRGGFALAPQGAGSCYAGDVPVLVEDSTHPGGCGQAKWSPACFTGGGFGFLVPEVQPGQYYRCTFKARSRLAYDQQTGWDIGISWEQAASNGHLLLDTHDENNRAAFTLGPAGTPAGAVTLSTLDRAAAFLLGALIALLAMVALARPHPCRAGINRDL